MNKQIAKLLILISVVLGGCDDRMTTAEQDYSQFESFAACRDYYDASSLKYLHAGYIVPEVRYPQLSTPTCEQFSQTVLARSEDVGDKYVQAFLFPKLVCIDPKLFYEPCDGKDESDLRECGVQNQIDLFREAGDAALRARSTITPERKEKGESDLKALEGKYPSSLCPGDGNALTTLFK